MPNYIEGELYFLSNANQAMNRRSCFNFEVTSIDAELTLRPKPVSRDCYLRRNVDLPAHAMERQIASNLQVIFVTADWLAGNGGAAKDDFRILVGVKHNLAQFFADNLLLLFGEDVAGFNH